MNLKLQLKQEGIHRKKSGANDYEFPLALDCG